MGSSGHILLLMPYSSYGILYVLMAQTLESPNSSSSESSVVPAELLDMATLRILEISIVETGANLQRGVPGQKDPQTDYIPHALNQLVTCADRTKNPMVVQVLQDTMLALDTHDIPGWTEMRAHLTTKLQDVQKKVAATTTSDTHPDLVRGTDGTVPPKSPRQIIFQYEPPQVAPIPKRPESKPNTDQKVEQIMAFGLDNDPVNPFRFLFHELTEKPKNADWGSDWEKYQERADNLLRLALQKSPKPVSSLIGSLQENWYYAKDVPFPVVNDHVAYMVLSGYAMLGNWKEYLLHAENYFRAYTPLDHDSSTLHMPYRIRLLTWAAQGLHALKQIEDPSVSAIQPFFDKQIIGTFQDMVHANPDEDTSIPSLAALAPIVEEHVPEGAIYMLRGILEKQLQEPDITPKKVRGVASYFYKFATVGEIQALADAIEVLTEENVTVQQLLTLEEIAKKDTSGSVLSHLAWASINRLEDPSIDLKAISDIVTAVYHHAKKTGKEDVVSLFSEQANTVHAALLRVSVPGLGISATEANWITRQLPFFLVYAKTELLPTIGTPNGGVLHFTVDRDTYDYTQTDLYQLLETDVFGLIDCFQLDAAQHLLFQLVHYEGPSELLAFQKKVIQKCVQTSDPYTRMVILTQLLPCIKTTWEPEEVLLQKTKNQFFYDLVFPKAEPANTAYQN
jgi:hypothetical protein